ncbi:MAG: carboxymuconolactone decarboxylase family protein [Janthinobacterium lividum]|uniref:carboxymuconolactone decarboxylase family protein n=1 Tax=Pseudomonas sp. MWU16-30317 TaxID=2878095 RepID=UPI001CFA2524|nr:carboxymuconolactone decarboxylase family protein [Pseudomonas sp. MWU16-30317]
MTRISILTAEQTPDASRPLLEGVKKAFGGVPNVFKVLAHSPAVLGTYLQFHQANQGSSLTDLQREVVALAVSQANACEYCLAVHTAIGGKAGLSADQLLGARDGSLDAYAHFARAVAEHRGNVSDQVIASARSAGLSDEVLLGIIAQVTLLTFTNLLNNVAQTTIDFPPVAL